MDREQTVLNRLSAGFLYWSVVLSVMAVDDAALLALMFC
jgi:hypothetical protein